MHVSEADMRCVSEADMHVGEADMCTGAPSPQRNLTLVGQIAGMACGPLGGMPRGLRTIQSMQVMDDRMTGACACALAGSRQPSKHDLRGTLKQSN